MALFEYQNPEEVLEGDYTSVVDLDDNYFLFAYSDPNDSNYGKVKLCQSSLNGNAISGKTFTFAETDARYISMLKLSTNKVLLLYVDNDNSVIITGLVITVYPNTNDINQSNLAFSTTQVSTEDAVTITRLSEIGTDKAILAFGDATDLDEKVMAISVSGTTITYGTAVQYNASLSAEEFDVCKLDTDKFLLGYEDAGVVQGELVVGTVSGTTITLGTPVQIAGTDSAGLVNLSQFTTDQAVLAYRNQTNNELNVVLITVAGTVPTVNTPQTVALANSNVVDVKVVSATEAVVVYQDGLTGPGYAIQATITGTSVSLGTAQEFDFNNIVDSTGGSGIINPQSGVFSLFYTTSTGIVRYVFGTYTEIVMTSNNGLVTIGTTPQKIVFNNSFLNLILQNTHLTATISLVIGEEKLAVDGEGLVLSPGESSAYSDSKQYFKHVYAVSDTAGATLSVSGQ